MQIQSSAFLLLATTWLASVASAANINLRGADRKLQFEDDFSGGFGLTPPSHAAAGHLFTMTNAASGNEVLMFSRSDSGSISFVNAFPTGGVGGAAQSSFNDPLASQDALILTNDGQCVLAVNAGSNTLTSFSVGADGLHHVGVYDSFGAFPVSVTHHGGTNTVFVLNAGDEGSFSAFKIGALSRCGLTPILTSTRSLTQPNGANPPFFAVSPSQIGFTPDGSHLVVLIKGFSHGIILTYPVQDGLVGEPITTISEGFTPFAFDFDNSGNLLVAEAFGTADHSPFEEDGPTPKAGAVTSYRIDSTGEVTTITSSAGTDQTATCWVRQHRDGCAYTTNQADPASISSMRVDHGGSVTLVESMAAEVNSLPLDLTIVDDFLYVLITGHGADGQPSIYVYQISPESCQIGLIEVVADNIPHSTATVFGVVGMAAN